MATASERYPSYIWHRMPYSVLQRIRASRERIIQGRRNDGENTSTAESLNVPCAGGNERKVKTASFPAPAERAEEAYIRPIDATERFCPVPPEMPNKFRDFLSESMDAKNPENSTYAFPADQSMGPELVSIRDEKQDENSLLHRRSSSTATGSSSRARHCLHFRGSRWGAILKNNRKGLESAFVADIVSATGVEAKHIENLKFAVADILIVTFTISPQEDEEKSSRVHTALQDFSFPRTTSLYKKRLA